MKIIAKGSCWGDSEALARCAVLELSDYTITAIQKMRGVLAANPYLANVAAYDSSAIFYTDDFLEEDGVDAWPSDDELRAQLEGDEYLVIDAGVEPPVDSNTEVSTAADMMHVAPEWVWWRSVEKYGDDVLETTLMRLSDLDCPAHWGDTNAKIYCLWCAVR